MIRMTENIEYALWKNNTLCPVCGANVQKTMQACETGYSYCSYEHARSHVEAVVGLYKCQN